MHVVHSATQPSNLIRRGRPHDDFDIAAGLGGALKRQVIVDVGDYASDNDADF